MRYIVNVLLLITFMVVGSLPISPSLAQEGVNPEGLWLTENERSVVKIEQCGEALCGRIAWIIDGGMQYDAKNPVEGLRGQPICGLEIMKELKPTTTPTKWDGGKIYKADDGDVYSVSLKINSADSLTIRGYKGISLLGKSQHWTRVSASNYPTCRKP